MPAWSMEPTPPSRRSPDPTALTTSPCWAQSVDADMPQDRYQPVCSVMEATGQLEGMEALRILGIEPLCVCDPAEALELEDALIEHVKEEALGAHAHSDYSELTDDAVHSAVSSGLGLGCGLESRHLESRPKAAARLDLEASAGWASPSSRGLWSGDALMLSIIRIRSDCPVALPAHSQVDSWHHLVASVHGVDEARDQLCTWPTKGSHCSLFDARL
jgi:hypothetical protein